MTISTPITRRRKVPSKDASDNEEAYETLPPGVIVSSKSLGAQLLRCRSRNRCRSGFPTLTPLQISFGIVRMRCSILTGRYNGTELYGIFFRFFS